MSMDEISKGAENIRTVADPFQQPEQVASDLGLKKKKKKKARKAPMEMPVVDSEQAKLAKRRSIAAQIKRRGRASTILTQSEKLG